MFVSCAAQAIVIDGQLGDWGVVPFTHWTPIAGTAYVTGNWGEKPNQHGAYPNGGEPFDLEAGYARFDSSTLYIAIVTSMPQGGVNDPYGRPRHYMPGDIAISLNGVSGFNWGIVGFGPNMGTVVQNPTWSLPDGSVGFPGNGPSTLSMGTATGQGSAVYVDAGVLEPDGSHTYIVEMAIPWSLMYLGTPIQNVRLHNAPTCGNDLLEWSMCVPNVPDPSVMALMGVGLAGLPLRRRMRSN